MLLVKPPVMVFILGDWSLPIFADTCLGWISVHLISDQHSNVKRFGWLLSRSVPGIFRNAEQEIPSRSPSSFACHVRDCLGCMSWSPSQARYFPLLCWASLRMTIMHHQPWTSHDGHQAVHGSRRTAFALRRGGVWNPPLAIGTCERGTPATS